MNLEDIKVRKSLHVFTTKCGWSGTGDEALLDGAVMRCPHCKAYCRQMLETNWWLHAKRFEEEENKPSYVEFLKWKEGQKVHFESLEKAAKVFSKTFKKPVGLRKGLINEH